MTNVHIVHVHIFDCIYGILIFEMDSLLIMRQCQGSDSTITSWECIQKSQIKGSPDFYNASVTSSDKIFTISRHNQALKILRANIVVKSPFFPDMGRRAQHSTAAEFLRFFKKYLYIVVVNLMSKSIAISCKRHHMTARKVSYHKALSAENQITGTSQTLRYVQSSQQVSKSRMYQNWPLYRARNDQSQFS